MNINATNFVEQMQRKNEAALMYVVDEYGGLLKSVIRKTMPYQKNLQEDCLNEVLFAVWEHIDSFHPEKNTFKNWVAAIAKYKAIDFMRKYKNETENVSYEALEEVGMKTQDNDPERILDEEISEKVNELLSCLKEKDRELFIRLYAKEESIDCISSDMGMEKSVIYNRVSRAKKKIRKISEV
jgi:RNA polymerase sigma-70 factor (ECF subfamily)